MHSATCGLGKGNKKKEKKAKKDSGKLAIRPDHQRRRSEVKVCMPLIMYYWLEFCYAFGQQGAAR